MPAAQPAVQFVLNETDRLISQKFREFLDAFSPEGYVPMSQHTNMSQEGEVSRAGTPAPRSYMARNVEAMCTSGSTLLVVDFE